MKFLLCGVVVAKAVVVRKTPSYHWLKEENNRTARVARILANIRAVYCATTT